MGQEIDATHRADRRSWVESANGHDDFPIQNLPLGIFTPPGGSRRGGVAIGEAILDLAAAHAAGLFSGEAARAAEAASGPVLNGFFALGSGPRRALRTALGDLLDAAHAPSCRELLWPAAACTLHVPARIGDYTDFFAGIHHATNAGRLLRPEAPLQPNYRYVPVAYHGRASSIRVSGTPVRRPQGQRKPGSATVPSFGPTRALDFELELGIWIGPGNALGDPIPIAEAAEHVAGFCLLNDWSARDIQGWEYQPLGPFLAKNFATTISPWVITPEALAPFRAAQPERDPRPLDYLHDAADQRQGTLDIELEVLLSPGGQGSHTLSTSNTRHLYWTVAQMVAHHSSGGCDLRSGDLFGSGTISGPGEAECGSLLELTQGGRKPIVLPSGETRRFLEDGDEVIFRAHARREGYATIGLGECRAALKGSGVR